MSTKTKLTPATDEELRTWKSRPCEDTQCRCIELHLDKAIARIEQEREIKLELAQIILDYEISKDYPDKDLEARMEAILYNNKT